VSSDSREYLRSTFEEVAELYDRYFGEKTGVPLNEVAGLGPPTLAAPDLPGERGGAQT